MYKGQVLLFAIFAFLALEPLFGQDAGTIALYEAGNYNEASERFKKELKYDSQNAGLWNYYALSLQKHSKLKDAEEAYKMALELDPSNSDYVSNLSFLYLARRAWNDAESSATVALKMNPENGNAYYSRAISRTELDKLEMAMEDCEQSISYMPGRASLYILKSEIFLRRLIKASGPDDLADRIAILRSSIEALDRCLTVCVGELSEIRKRIESQKALFQYYEIGQVDGEGPHEPFKECVPLRIKTKPRPGYTDSARREAVTGTISVLVVFRSDGKIRQIVLLQGLPAGLNQKVLDSAKGIEFEPERCDGNPITVVKTISYRFSLY
ncbi:MAG: tetratricopeptide repeat protein [Acidobacteriota bacterium]|nr:tetratricopeptide repeat protein [Acidobacteriota bacterium]